MKTNIDSFKVFTDWWEREEKLGKPKNVTEHIERWFDEEIVSLRYKVVKTVEDSKSPLHALVLLHLSSLNTEKLFTNKVVAGKIADFLIESSDNRLVIQIGENTKENDAKDRKIIECGYKVVRFTEDEILNDITYVIQKIIVFLS